MGRAKGQVAAVSMQPSRNSRNSRSEFSHINLSVQSLTAGFEMAEREELAREELIKRFGQYVEFSSPKAINAHLELLIEGLSDEVYDFGRTRQERAVFKEMLHDLKAINQDLEDIAGISHFEAAEKERLKAEEEGRVRHKVKVLSRKSKEIRSRLPRRSELWNLTWETPVARMHTATAQREAGELTNREYLHRLSLEASVGVVNTFKTLWHFTGALRGANGAIKATALTVAATSSVHMDSHDALRISIAAGAISLVGAGIWTDMMRRRRRRRKIEHELAMANSSTLDGDSARS
jgi:hypothetical protein